MKEVKMKRQGESEGASCLEGERDQEGERDLEGARDFNSERVLEVGASAQSSYCNSAEQSEPLDNNSDQEAAP